MASPVTLSQIPQLTHLSHADADFQRQTIADLLHRPTLHFPGAQPVSFARKHLAELRQRDYFMCEKTDGVRCLLFLTQLVLEGEVVEAQFLIDRKNDYYYVQRDALHLPRPDDWTGFHTGTILDGELVRQVDRKTGNSRLAYLIFDCLAIDNEDITKRTFDKRLARVSEWISKPLKSFAARYPEDVAAQPFQVEIKQMEFPYGTEMMFRDKIPSLPHGNDGLIFTCRETAYVPGTDEHILKWKPPHENTIDFRLILGAFPTNEDDDGEFEDWDGKPQLDLYVNHGGGGEGYKRFASLTLTATEWESFKSLNQQLDGRIIECYRSSDTQFQGAWRPKLESNGAPRFRDDKKDANHISVVNSVIESIEDAVSEEDLIESAGSIRDAYKQRQRRREEEQRRMAEAEKARRAQADERARRESAAPRAMEVEEDEGPSYED